MTENYLDILEESLNKKIEVLTDIQQYNNRQEEVFRAAVVDLTVFDEYVEEKSGLIERVKALDEGFEQLYASVAEELKNNREQYKVQIGRLQELVAQVTEMSMSIQAQEARNKQLVEEYFARERSGIKQGRRSSKAAYDYYKNMNKTAVVQPQFLDSKK